MAKKKGRINTKGKSYSINDSALFNIQSKNKLAEVLLTNLDNIKSLLSNDNYIVFDNTNEDGKSGLFKPHQINLMLCIQE